MIYGTPGDRNIIRLIHWIYRWPVLPIFGNGLFLQQPVYVSDVAWSIVQALESPATINRQFNISGAEPLSYNKLVSTTAKALSRRIRCLHIPAQPVVRMLDILEHIGAPLPIKAEQILRLNEHKEFSHSDAQKVFGYNPISFEEGVRREVALFLSSRCKSRS